MDTFKGKIVCRFYWKDLFSVTLGRPKPARMRVELHWTQVGTHCQHSCVASIQHASCATQSINNTVIVHTS